MHYYIKADRFFLRSGMEIGGYLEVKDGLFGRYSKTEPTGEILDYSGKWIAPGLVDTHIHGYKGHDVMDGDFDGLNEISRGLLSCGVTSFFAYDVNVGCGELESSQPINRRALPRRGRREDPRHLL